MKKHTVLAGLLAGLLEVFVLSGCGISEAIRLQKMSATCAQLSSPPSEIYEMAEPDRLRKLVPLAEECGKVATPYEIARISSGLSRSVRRTGSGTNNSEMEQEEVRTRQEHFQLETRKTAYLSYGCLAAYAPEDKVRAIIREQIISGGEFYKESLEFLAYRLASIEKYRLSPLVEASETTWVPGQERFTLVQLRKAKDYLALMKSIAELPFASQIGFYVSDGTGNLPADADIGDDLTPDFLKSKVAGAARKTEENFRSRATAEDVRIAEAQGLFAQLR